MAEARQPLRVLILEDRPADADLVLQELRRAGFEPDWRHLKTESDFVAALHPAVDVILADCSMLQLDASRALDLWREAGQEIPFIVVSGPSEMDRAVSLLREGATDYVLKDRLVRLGPSVARALSERALRVARREAETARLAGEERLRSIVGHIQEIIFAVRVGDDPLAGTLEYVSPQVEAITGFRPEEFLQDGDLWRRVVHSDDVARLAEETRRIIAGGAPATREYRLRHKDGHYVWVEDQFTPTYDASGRLAGLVGAARDVTERRQAQERAGRRQREIEAALGAERRQRAVAEALQELALELNAELDEERILARTLALASRVVPGHSGTVILIEGDTARVAATLGPNLESRLGERRPLDQLPGLGEMARTGRPLRVANLGTGGGVTLLTKYEEPQSYLAAPLTISGQFIGSLSLRQTGVGAYTEEHEQRLAAFASQASLALQNARLLRQTREQRDRMAEQMRELEERSRHLHALVQAGVAVSSSQGLEQVLQRVLDQAVRLLAGHSAVVRLASGPERWDVLSARGVSDRFLRRPLVAPGRAPVAGRAWRERTPVTVEDVRMRTDFDPQPLLEEGILASVALPLVAGDRALGVLIVHKAEPHRFSGQEIAALTVLADQAAWAIAHARLLQQTEERSRHLESLIQAGLALGATLDLDRILEQVVASACLMVGARASALRVLTGPAQWEIRAAQGLSDGTVARLREFMPGDARNSARVLRNATAVAAEDLEQAADFPTRATLLGEGIRAATVLPLRTGGHTIGILSVYVATPHHFPQDELAALGLLAEQAALAIEQARLFEQAQADQTRLRELSRRLVEAQEEERRHLARELHDEVGQAITGISLAIELARRVPTPQVTARLDQAQASLAHLLAQVRNLSLDLRPAMLDDLGLLPALRWLFQRYTAQTGVPVRTRHRGLDRRLPPAVETAAYRIVQEALTNVARHAAAPEVTARLAVSGGRLKLTIADRGRGFTVAALAPGRTGGLSGMQERALLLGGSLAIESALGAGTRISAELPLGALTGQELGAPTAQVP